MAENASIDSGPSGPASSVDTPSDTSLHSFDILTASFSSVELTDGECENVTPQYRAFTCNLCNPPRTFKQRSGFTNHSNLLHRNITPPPGEDVDDSSDKRYEYERHPHLTAEPCTVTGDPLSKQPSSTLNQPSAPSVPNAWDPFTDRAHFDLAHFSFLEAQLSEGKTNRLFDIVKALLARHGQTPLTGNAQQLYALIDSIQEGSTQWKVYKFKYRGVLPPDPPQWMRETYELVARCPRDVVLDQLRSTSFHGRCNYTPYRQFIIKNNKRIRLYSNLMSGQWAWDQADHISDIPDTKGAMLVPIVLGSDKTTVSVATGHQEFHPCYISPGNLTNIARRAHGNGVMPFAFLPIPRSE
ncbi:hypothetical protein VNI00_014284 [Paramarasmius palmivorus]|uniref:C2H2-type domain-containing protein n=1 Tax=Paramarasmius palmivorus TaxID=297713 RepID=A0AAW0BU91_9AGAR